jgi:hypothetical protein
MKVRWIVIALLCMAWLPVAASATVRCASSTALLSAALPQEHDWEHDRRFEGRNPGYRQGFQDGFEDGRRDHERGAKWHYGAGYKHPDRGYRGEFGDKHDYEREYREGYEQAYKEAYGERR